MNEIEMAFKKSEINKAEMEEIVADVFSTSFLSNKVSADEIVEMETFVDSMTILINQSIRNTDVRANKIKLIQLVGKLSNLRDLLNLKTGRLTSEGIQEAGKQLGAKAQSAFGE